MPRKERNDYSFYKIVCLDNSVDLCYVGSTANFKQRRWAHKTCSYNENDKKSYNNRLYTTIRENGGWDNFKMIEIGKREQLTCREAEQIEEEYRQELKANMNTIRCFITQEENKQYRKEYEKDYREKNKEILKEKKKQYYQANKEEKKAKSKEYYQKKVGK